MPCAHCPSSDVAYWLSGLRKLVNSFLISNGLLWHLHPSSSPSVDVYTLPTLHQTYLCNNAERCGVYQRDQRVETG